MVMLFKTLLIETFLSMFIFSFALFADANYKKELRSRDEVIIIKESNSDNNQGFVFAKKNECTNIIIAKNLGNLGKIASSELEKYLPLSCNCLIKLFPESKREKEKKGFTILLATDLSDNLIKWAGLRDQLAGIHDQGCLIQPVTEFPDGTKGIALVGGSPRGLLNGVYTLLERSSDLWWEPVRILNKEYPLNSHINETIITHSSELAWEWGYVNWKPTINERIIYMTHKDISQKSIDWASRNRLSHLVIATPYRTLPMLKENREKIKLLVDYAHGCGLKVLFLNMTHRLPSDAPTMMASSDAAIELSTELYVNQFKYFGLDGMAWHTASEGINFKMGEQYHKRPRIEWEAKYFNSYYKAIRNVNKDAILVMLMGWFYMNPAERLAELFPKDIVSWVVPNTPIIDASTTDLDSYDKHFDHIWYWLYVMVSRDSIFPMVKVDYLEKYFREAINRGHNLAPQAILYNNTANTMYYVQTARDGIIPHEDFLKSFGERYYQDQRMGDVLLKYQDALKHHRNWYSNIHTVELNNFLTFEEVALLNEIGKTTIEVAKASHSKLIQNRLKSLAVTTLRCLMRRIPSPEKFGKGWNWQFQQYYDENLTEYRKMIKDMKIIFADHYFGEEKDFFWDELLKLERELNNIHAK